ncbi:N-acetylneuraminate synthase [Thalassotalea fusca]
MSNTLIIAEAGVNHNGSLQTAIALVDAAVASGVDIIKFQTYVTEQLVTKDAKQANYQSRNIGRQESQFDMLKRLELSFDEHLMVKQHCDERGICYLSTAFDLKSLDFLVNHMELALLKIPSGEITNAPYLLAHAKSGCQLIVSTGMATLREISDALATLAFGMVNSANTLPANLDACYQVMHSEAGQKALQANVTLLHCTSEYPAPIEHVNLSAMQTMAEEFKLPIGYSDHTEGLLIPAVAVAMGASVIEKHFTLDRNMAGPDHAASIEPDELAEMVVQIRTVEMAKGAPIKKPSQTEIENSRVARKSIVANENIKAGQMFTVDNTSIMRPGTGISPMRYWELLTRKAQKNYQSGDIIDNDEV